MSERFIFAPETIIKAYSLGVFPMAQSVDDPELHFFEPDIRGIIPLAPVHIPRRLMRLVKQRPFEIRINTAFSDVIHSCAEITCTREDSWINDEIKRLYIALHSLGFAHSVEVFDNDKLVGGLYGVKLGGVFFGESMFSRTPNASKIGLVHLIARLLYGKFSLLDAQFSNEHLKQFGLAEIPKAEFQDQLQSALQQDADLNLELGEDVMIDHLLQVIKVTS